MNNKERLESYEVKSRLEGLREDEMKWIFSIARRQQAIYHHAQKQASRLQDLKEENKRYRRR